MIRVGHGLTLRGSGAAIAVPEASRAGLASWRAGRAATQARVAAKEVISLDSSVSFGYDGELNSRSYN